MIDNLEINKFVECLSDNLYNNSDRQSMNMKCTQFKDLNVKQLGTLYLNIIHHKSSTNDSNEVEVYNQCLEFIKKIK